MPPAPTSFRHVLRVVLGVALALTFGCNSALYLRTHYGFKKDLTATIVTEHFDIRYRPDAKASRQAQRIGQTAERELARICARLQVANDTRFTLFLFEDLGDLAKTSHTTTYAGYASGTAAVCGFVRCIAA